MEELLPNYFCLDHPEKIFLRDGKKEKPDTVLWIEAWQCSVKENCKTEKEIQDFKKREDIELVIITNQRSYQPNKYGNEMVLEFADLF